MKSEMVFFLRSMPRTQRQCTRYRLPLVDIIECYIGGNVGHRPSKDAQTRKAMNVRLQIKIIRFQTEAHMSFLNKLVKLCHVSMQDLKTRAP